MTREFNSVLNRIDKVKSSFEYLLRNKTELERKIRSYQQVIDSLKLQAEARERVLKSLDQREYNAN